MLKSTPGSDRMRSRIALAAFAAAIALAPAAAFAQSAAVRVATDLSAPIYVAAPAGDDRLFIVERAGTIKVLQNGSVLGTDFLDITDRVIVPPNSEAGLLSLAFDPDYAENGAFYVFYVGDASGTNEIRVARFIAANPASSDPVDPNSEAILFRLTHPEDNHFGGTVAIRGGFLYVGLGDGGGGGDPNDQSQQDGRLVRQDAALRSRAAAACRGRPRPGRRASAIRSASASTARPATSTSATSARTRSRRSTSSRPTTRAGATTAGT